MTSPNSQPLQVGIVEHFGISSTKDCLPKSKAKLLESVNQIPYHNSDYWHNLSIDVIGNEKKRLGKSEIRNLQKRNPIHRQTNNPLLTIPKKTPRITPKIISLQIREAHCVTLRRRTPISPINSARTKSSHKPNVHANSIIISAYFVEVLGTLPKNVLNPLLQRQKLRLMQRRLSLTAHPSLKTQKKLKQPFGLHTGKGLC